MDLSDLDPSGLSDEELDLLDAQLRTVRDRVDAVRYARVARRELSAETWTSMELRLQEASDPETNAAVAAHGPHLGPHLRPPSARAVENTAKGMALEGFSEECVAEHVLRAALERGMPRPEAIQATGNGIRKARRARRAVT
jgi:hypothetical protein